MVTVVGEEGLVPRARSSLPLMCSVVLGLITLAFAWLLDSDGFSVRIGMMALCLTVQTSIHSVCLFAEEWIFHSQQRYHGSISRMLQACFSRHVTLGICAVILILLLSRVSFTKEQWGTMALTCAIYLLLKGLRLMEPCAVEISEICETKKMNVAHGLAWSFYLGYLKYVLPELEKNINSTTLKLSSPRLHILLPLNAAVPDKPEEVDSRAVFHENLPELQLDKAGVRKRSYKNSVYKIIGQNNESFYCVLEYATPLLTLYKMSQERSAGFGERERKQQVLLFYRTLSQILEDSLECRNRFRLVLLNDEHTGNPHYLSSEIIQHLKQQDGEIHMNPVQNAQIERIGHPIPEEFPKTDVNHLQRGAPPDDEMSTDPTLMFSVPGSLRAEPVETTYYQHDARR